MTAALRRAEEMLHVPQVRDARIQVLKRFTGGGTVVVDSNTIFATLIFQVLVSRQHFQKACFAGMQDGIASMAALAPALVKKHLILRGFVQSCWVEDCFPCMFICAYLMLGWPSCTQSSTLPHVECFPQPIMRWTEYFYKHVFHDHPDFAMRENGGFKCFYDMPHDQSIVLFVRETH